MTHGLRGPDRRFPLLRAALLGMGMLLYLKFSGRMFPLLRAALHLDPHVPLLNVLFALLRAATTGMMNMLLQGMWFNNKILLLVGASCSSAPRSTWRSSR